MEFLVCDGVGDVVEGVPDCTGSWEFLEIQPDLEAFDPAVAGFFYSVGFAAIVIPWLAARGLGAALDFIRGRS